jgi:hypothetical protein
MFKGCVCEGNKLNNLDVVYTPWFNLRKTQGMDVGQVGFHNPKLVRAFVLPLTYSLVVQVVATNEQTCLGFFLHVYNSDQSLWSRNCP